MGSLPKAQAAKVLLSPWDSLFDRSCTDCLEACGKVRLRCMTRWVPSNCSFLLVNFESSVVAHDQEDFEHITTLDDSNHC